MGSLAASAAKAAVRVASSAQCQCARRIAAQTMGVKSIAVAPCSRGRNQVLCFAWRTLLMTADCVAIMLQ